jgi:hypothetical protein
MMMMNSLTNFVVVVFITVGVLISEHRGVNAFLPSTTSTTQHHASSSRSPLYSIWTNWIPETTTDFMDMIVAGPSSSSSKNNSLVSKKIEATTTTSKSSSSPNGFLAGTAVFFTVIALSLSVFTQPAYAVSGGGSDFAGQDISNQDFSNQNYKLKDFTQVLARKTNFQSSIFTGCRFQNGYLIDADFSNADLRGVSFERTNMENVVLKVSGFPLCFLFFVCFLSPLFSFSTLQFLLYDFYFFYYSVINLYHTLYILLECYCIWCIF